MSGPRRGVRRDIALQPLDRFVDLLAQRALLQICRNPPSLRIRQQPFRSRRKRYCSFQLRLMQMAERRIDLSLRRPPFGCLYA